MEVIVMQGIQATMLLGVWEGGLSKTLDYQSQGVISATDVGG